MKAEVRDPSSSLAKDTFFYMGDVGRYLYRGISEEMHRKNQGLQPRDTSFYRAFHSDEGFHLDQGLTLDESVNNAVISHQVNSKKFPTSGVSTTPFLDRAKIYATHNKKRVKGIIYKIDRELLMKNNITEYRVRDYTTHPAIPEDDEVILVSDNNGALPMEIVVEVITVTKCLDDSGCPCRKLQ